MWQPNDCDCHCVQTDPGCSGSKATCSPGGVAHGCLGVNGQIAPPGLQYESPPYVTTYTGVAAFEVGRTCVTDITGRIWRKRAEPAWHIYDIVHSAGDELNDITFVVKQTGRNERQRVRLDGSPTGGTFTLSFDDTGSNNQTTDPIAFDANVATIETAIEALTNIDEVTVNGGPIPTSPFFVEFVGNQAQTDVPRLTIDTTGLTGPNPNSGTIATIASGRPQITVGIAVGNAGTILRSADNGATWASVATGVIDDLLRVATSGRFWFVVGRAGTFLKSEDDGQSWSLISTGSAADFTDVAVSGSKLWIAGGVDLLRSIDRGATWSLISGITGIATCIATAEDRITWVFTTNTGTAGKIWKTTDRGLSWAEHSLSGTVGNETLRAVVSTDLFGDYVHCVTTQNVTAPTLPEVRQRGQYRAVSLYGRNLYLAGFSGTGLPANVLKSPCLGGSPTQWTVRRINESVPFSYCPLAAFAGEVPRLVQTANVAGCVWGSLQRDVFCDFVPGGPLGIDAASWTLDLSGADALLTFETSASGKTAVYRLQMTEWQTATGNKLVFDESSSTDGPTGHDELWVCPGTYEPCGVCGEFSSWEKYAVTIPPIPGITPGFTSGPLIWSEAGNGFCAWTDSVIVFAAVLYFHFPSGETRYLFRVLFGDYLFLSHDPNSIGPAGPATCAGGDLPIVLKFNPPQPDPSGDASFVKL